MQKGGEKTTPSNISSKSKVSGLQTQIKKSTSVKKSDKKLPSTARGTDNYLAGLLESIAISQDTKTKVPTSSLGRSAKHQRLDEFSKAANNRYDKIIAKQSNPMVETDNIRVLNKDLDDINKRLAILKKSIHHIPDALIIISVLEKRGNLIKAEIDRKQSVIVSAINTSEQFKEIRNLIDSIRI